MKAKKLFSKIAIAVTFLFAMNASANNVQITGTSVSGSNITFTISWDNSWNANVAPANWDAVWVFIKYQDCNTRVWAHAGLSSTASDHTTVSPLQVDPVTDGKGVFIRRSSLGGGTVGATSVTLKMTIPAGTYNYKVFGVEMVNVPQSAFELGDGTSASTFNSINVTSTSQSAGLTAAIIGGSSANLPAVYPMGYNSIYCMKYEISQEQYVEFLNSLTYLQQKAHTITDPISAVGTAAFNTTTKNGIRISTPGNNSAIPAIYTCDATVGVENNIDDGQNVAANNMNWADLAAYLDWAALRPMTELEYEKISRGPVSRLAGEYPWGTTDIQIVTPANVINVLKPNEGYNTAVNGLCNYFYQLGAPAYTNFGYNFPLKVGFSATGTSGRISAGAAYYGAMEMGGNVAEQVVNTTANGVTFTGTLGDGTISALGDANQTSWPSLTTALGIGLRGGSYTHVVTTVRTSDRSLITSTPDTRSSSNGGRGVR